MPPEYKQSENVRVGAENASVQTGRSVRPAFIVTLLASVALALVAGITLTLLGGGVAEKGLLETAPLDQETAVAPLPLKGTIFLTLARTGENTQGVYAYDVGAHNLAEYLLRPSTLTRAGAWSKNGMLYVASNIASLTTGGTLSTRQIQSYAPEVGLIQVTDSDVKNKRTPSWSEPLQALLYGAREEDKSGELSDDYVVYVRFSNKKEEVISRGSLPTLTPDGRSFLVMRNDGLYLVDIMTKESEKISTVGEGPFHAGNHFALSSSGKKLALSVLNKGTVSIFDITSWKPFTLSPAKTISANAFWPVFSPDGRFVAVEALGSADAGPAGSRKLVVYDIVSGQSQDILDLSGFDPEQISISEWR